jgi:hypothetical protein
MVGTPGVLRKHTKARGRDACLSRVAAGTPNKAAIGVAMLTLTLPGRVACVYLRWVTTLLECRVWRG